LDLIGLLTPSHLSQALLHLLVLSQELIDSRFGFFGLVEVLVDHRGLRLAETDEVDQVGEDFDESIVSRFCKIGEGKVIDSALNEEMNC
jgi:hypothetical protein